MVFGYSAPALKIVFDKDSGALLVFTLIRNLPKTKKSKHLQMPQLMYTFIGKKTETKPRKSVLNSQSC